MFAKQMKEVGGIKKVPKTVLKRRRNFKLKRMLVPKAGGEFLLFYCAWDQK